MWYFKDELCSVVLERIQIVSERWNAIETSKLDKGFRTMRSPQTAVVQRTRWHARRDGPKVILNTSEVHSTSEEEPIHMHQGCRPERQEL